MESSAEAEIRRRIASHGQIPFAEFMEVALYHPTDGYYSGPSPIGEAGDYFTSPVAHPAFGALLAIQLQRMWELIGRPATFHLVEMGAGGGALATDLIAYAAGMPGPFSKALRYVCLERSAGSIRAPGEAQRLSATAEALPLGGVVGCFLSNELVDSFPVHRFRIQEGAPKEIYVAVDGRSNLVETLGHPTTPAISERLSDLATPLPEGYEGEVRPGAFRWTGQVSGALARGFVATIDYGYDTEELYADTRSAGTVQSHFRHGSNNSPYRRVGRQDITAHVDFGSLTSAGEALGLRPLALLRQSVFLKGLGFEQMVQQVRAMDLGQGERDANLMGMRELVDDGGLGAFRVLIQERGTGIEDASQLTPLSGVASEVRPPLLGAHHVRLMEGRYPHLAWTPEGLWPYGPGENG